MINAGNALVDCSAPAMERICSHLSLESTKNLFLVCQGLSKNSVVKRQLALFKRLQETKLFLHVVRGDLEAVRQIFATGKNKDLLLAKSTFTDLSGRMFIQATAFQYAAWALDTDMWNVLLTYFEDKADASEQLDQLERSPEDLGTNGSHYDLQKLIDVGQEYLNKYDSWPYEKRRSYWQKSVGKEQWRCPAWLMYTWYEKGETVYWTTKDVKRPVKRDPAAINCFTEKIHNGGKLGVTWGVWRGGRGERLMGGHYKSHFLYHRHDIEVQKLTRQNLHESLCMLAAELDVRLTRSFS